MKISIGIVSFNNSPDQLVRLLESISSSYDQAREKLAVDVSIIGIDNGEACLQLALQRSQLAFSIKHQILNSQGNIGFGTAMNVLMEKSFGTDVQESADLFIAVNPDGLLHRECIEKIVLAATESSDCLLEARQFPEEHPKPYSAETGETSWATGACLAIPRKIFETIGGFDECLFMYAEDVDLSWRARAAGFNVKLIHNAIFIHPTLGRIWSKNAKKHFFLSAVYLAHKWRAKEFEQLYEDDYRARFGHSEDDISLLESTIKAAKKSSSEIVNNTDFKPFFDKSRSFSPARWSH